MHHLDISSESYKEQQIQFFDELDKHLKLVMYNNSIGVDTEDIPYSEGLSIDVFDPAELSIGTKLDGTPYPEWIYDVMDQMGRRYKEGVLIGFNYTFMDYYYILLDDNKIRYHSCVGSLTQN